MWLSNSSYTGGSIQQYTYKQEPIKKCTGRRPAINYPVYGAMTQVRRRRFERATGPSQILHTIRIHHSPIRVSYQDKGSIFYCVKNSYIWSKCNIVSYRVRLIKCDYWPNNPHTLSLLMKTSICLNEWPKISTFSFCVRNVIYSVLLVIINTIYQDFKCKSVSLKIV